MHEQRAVRRRARSPTSPRARASAAGSDVRTSAAGLAAEVGHRALLDQGAVGDDHDVVDGLLDLLQQVAGDQHGLALVVRRGGAGSRAASGCPRGRGRWPARRGPAAAGRRAATGPAQPLPHARSSSRRPACARTPGCRSARAARRPGGPARRRPRRWCAGGRGRSVPGCTSVASSAAPTTASGRRGRRTPGRRSVAVPDVGRTRPSSIRSVVVLPAPFGPEEAGDPARRDREAEVVDGGQRAEPLGQPRELDGHAHGGRSCHGGMSVTFWRRTRFQAVTTIATRGSGPGTRR